MSPLSAGTSVPEVQTFSESPAGGVGGSGRGPTCTVRKSHSTVPCRLRGWPGTKRGRGKGSFQDQLLCPWALALSSQPCEKQNSGGEKLARDQISPSSLLCQRGFAWTPGTPDAKGIRAPRATKVLGASLGIESRLSPPGAQTRAPLCVFHLPGTAKDEFGANKGRPPHLPLSRTEESPVPGWGGCPTSSLTWEASARRDPQQQQQYGGQQQCQPQSGAPHGARALLSAPRCSALPGAGGDAPDQGGCAVCCQG